jgi:hypothetical protein
MVMDARTSDTGKKRKKEGEDAQVLPRRLRLPEGKEAKAL